MSFQQHHYTRHMSHMGTQDDTCIQLVQRLEATLSWFLTSCIVLVYVPKCVCVCVWLRDWTAGKLMIELLILSDLTIFIYHFMPLYIFLSLSRGRVQYVSSKGM